MANPSLVGVSSLKLALMAKQARAQLGAVARAEPIAIIGMGCRFPGGADSPDKYWALLRDGVDAVTDIPRDRWDVDGLYDPDPAEPGKVAAKCGGFLEQVAGFDAPFFGILSREAERMDPQQRLFLEVAIEALDHAGLSREKLAGSNTGAFIASYYNDYTLLQFADREWIDGRTLTGTQHSVLVNRLSYLLDLRGPSVSVDTACSSSLVAIHLACQSLRAGESDAALAGGVSLILAPEMMITLSKIGFMSPTGRCRTFDARADGFIRGEGCGVVVLKRLSDAINDNDRVLAVIRGSAVNQDGRSTVLAAPNGLAQQALLREALSNAQLTPDRVGFVEAHGTATPLGDPIEVEALAAVIGAPRADGSTCYLGSAKANLGHLEAASGVAGLIKAALVLQHREIPRQVHFERLNPHLSLAGTCLAVADRHRAWPASAQPRVAGVSGFGVGGTNAHVLVEEAPALPASEPAGTDEPQFVALSAQSPAALGALVASWLAFLPTSPDSLADLAATAGLRRSHYDHRLGVVTRSKGQLEAQLRSIVAEGSLAAVAVGHRPPRIAFVFSGQGPQWAQMTSELAAAEPVFRDVLADLDTRFQRLAGWSLAAVLAEPAASLRLQDTEFAQPAIFAVQVALAALWEAWGIRPDAVVGHSIGELAALYVAGVLSLDDAVRIVWHRGQIMQRATGLGRMASVGLTLAEAETLVREIGPELSVAAVNAPRSVVLSGSAAALAAALTVLEARGVSQRALPVSYAFHSAQMAPFQAELVSAIGELHALPSRVAVYSSVTGAEIEHTHIDAAYFGRNVRQTVRFASAIDAVLDARVDAFVELSPHPVLAASIAECLAARRLEVPVLTSMRRERAARETLLQALAGVYAAGGTPRWEALTKAPAPPTSLPAYPWQRERFWLRARPPSEATSVPALLGTRVSAADGTVTYQARWPDAVLSWLVDHEVAGRVVMPAVALLEALRRAAYEVHGTRAATLVDFVVNQPLVLEGASGWTIVVSADPDGVRLELWTGAEGACDRLIASARAVALREQAPSSVSLVDSAWTEQPRALYERFAELGVRFGPAFRTLERWRMGDGSAEAWLALDGPASSESGRHVALVDGALQLCLVALSGGEARSLLLPLGVDSYTLYRPLPARVRAEVSVAEHASGASVGATVRLFSEDGALLAALDGVRFAAADAASLADVGPYEIRWQQVASLPAASTGAARGEWLLLGDESVTSRALATALSVSGGQARRLSVTEPEALSASLAEVNGLRGIVHLGGLESALSLVHAMGRGTQPGVPLWFVTEGAQPATGSVLNPAQAALWGLANVVGPEYPDVPCRVVDLDPAFDVSAALVRELTQTHPTEARCALRAGARYVPRLERRAPHRGTLDSASPLQLVVARPGTLDGLAWQVTHTATPGAGEVRLHVLAAGVNFRDVLLTLGMYPAEGAVLGAECAGIVAELGAGVSAFKVGDVVFGFASGSIATELNVPAHFLSALPEALRAEDAAALPAAFLTALYGLQEVAQLEPGATVLIHAGAGGVGQAAIQVAQRRGCRVFATAGSAAKREFLRTLGVEGVFDSRSLAFADEVRAATSGKGVDALLNSLSGEFIPAGLRALAAGGWFLELGKREVWTPEQVESARPDVQYRVYDLGTELHADATLAPRLLADLCAGLSDGSLRPLPVRIFGFAEASEAFRSMAQAAHVGKLVLRAPPNKSQAKRAALVQPEATYWVTGGAGALGLHTARWLVQSGATHVVLTGRSAPTSEAQLSINECVAQGARVEFRVADAADEAAMRAVRDEIAASWPPLRGVVHAAGVVDDGMLVSQTWPRFQAVLRSKALGARLLDALTRELDLDFFVLYSSAGWLLGPIGQGAYAAANAELDALACARRASGRPTLSVAWGQWREGGMAARLAANGHDRWSALGLGWLGAPEALRQLELLLRADVTQAVVLPIDWSRFLTRLPAGVDAEFFRALKPAKRAAKLESAPSRDRALVERWKAAPASERRGLLLLHLHERTHHVLGVASEVVLDERAALKDAGLDSLMAVELRNVLTRSLGTSLPATLLFDYASLDALASYLMTYLQLAPLVPPEPSTSTLSESVTRVAALSDAEAEAQLLAELDAGAVAVR
ncbi:MAG: type I polyketide synthase [Polyangiaceae bacterium]